MSGAYNVRTSNTFTIGAIKETAARTHAAAFQNHVRFFAYRSVNERDGWMAKLAIWPSPQRRNFNYLNPVHGIAKN